MGLKGDEEMGFQIQLFLLLTMFFCHIVDDYYLQGCLANLKQKRWWENNNDRYMYRNDYKMALAEHGFSWAFVTSIPIFSYYFICGKSETLWIVICFVIANACIHTYVDNLKANKNKINLIQDQTAHFVQILVTWLLCCIVI